MHPLLNQFLITAGVVAGAVTILALLVMFLVRMGGRIAHVLTRAPLLDLVVASLTWLPWVFGAVAAGWIGFAGAITGQMAALFVWIGVHEAMHPGDRRGPRIVKFINGAVGRWRNHAALWVTMVALPGFWLVRIIEIVAYPFLVWLLRFPKYRHSEWINVSRHKFEGLIGHDLIWCLYCDWMTGVYALGGEMLRNVESFWCPIRFYDGKKCENCRVDFPDINGGWVPATGNMNDVATTMEKMYGDGSRTWFGHPIRVTVKGKTVGDGNNGDRETSHVASAGHIGGESP